MWSSAAVVLSYNGCPSHLISLFESRGWRKMASRECQHQPFPRSTRTPIDGVALSPMMATTAAKRKWRHVTCRPQWKESGGDKGGDYIVKGHMWPSWWWKGNGQTHPNRWWGGARRDGYIREAAILVVMVIFLMRLGGCNARCFHIPNSSPKGIREGREGETTGLGADRRYFPVQWKNVKSWTMK